MPNFIVFEAPLPIYFTCVNFISTLLIALTHVKLFVGPQGRASKLDARD